MMGTHACHAHAHAHHSIISQSQAQASLPRPLAWSAQFVRETAKEKENQEILREKARAAYEKWARKWEQSKWNLLAWFAQCTLSQRGQLVAAEAELSRRQLAAA